MRKYILLLLLFITPISVFSQFNPIAHELNKEPYFFSSWNSDAPAGTFPESMYFLQYQGDDEPDKNTIVGQLWQCAYNSDSRSRYVGLGLNGIGIVNSGSVQDTEDRCGNESFRGAKVGVVVLALNTSNMEEIELSWKIRLIEQGNGNPLPRAYRIQAQYRSDTSESWSDFPSSISYSTQGKITGDVQNVKVFLPKQLENKEYVQVRWKYYQDEANQGGTRPFIALDDIKVVGINSITPNLPFVFIENENLETFGCIEGDFSEVDSIVISAAFLRDNLEIAIGGNFYISLSKIDGYTQKLNLINKDGVVSESTIYIKKKCNDISREIEKLYFRSKLLNKNISLIGEGYYKLFINEVVASNFISYYDPYTKDYPDWIEIYNPNGDNIQLGNYFLTDDINDLTKFKIGVRSINIISNKGFVVYSANNVIGYSGRDLNFSLSKYGGSVLLVGKNGKTIIDSLTYGNLEADISYGRELDGSNTFVNFKTTTPGESNSKSIPYGEKSENPVFSVIGGKYDQPFALGINASSPNAKIYYTIDGSDPNPDNLGGFVYEYKIDYQYRGAGFIGDSYFRPYRSYLFLESIDLGRYMDKLFWISDITASYQTSIIRQKRPPAVTVRALVIEEGKEPSDIISNTYFFSNDDPVKDELPIISLTLNENQLKGFYEGIGVPGVDYETWRYTSPILTNMFSPANYRRSGRPAEIPSNIEVFENGKQVLNQSVGLRIHGGGTRSAPHKSFRIYARNFYGKDVMTYPFFKNLPYEDFQRLILRNSGNDFSGTFFKDAFIQRLMKFNNVDYQEYTPYNIYINGEYWGLLNARERIDIKYFQRKYGFNESDIDFLENNKRVIEGDTLHYASFLRNLSNIDLTSEESYNYVDTIIDIDNYIDYQSSKIYVGVIDWPHNNVRYWRYKINQYKPKSPYGLDGRWRWVNIDNDSGLNKGEEDLNSFDWALSPTGNDRGENATFLFRSLIENPKFKIQFLTRFSDLLNTAFLPKRVIGEISYYKNLLEHDMINYLNRWNINSRDINIWYNKVKVLEDFATVRPNNCINHMRKTFNLGETAEVTLDVDDINKGHIKINTIEINRNTPGVDTINVYQWKGIYFKNLPISFVPIPQDGYKFSRWETTDSTSYIDTLKFDLKKNLFVKAYFEIDDNYIYNPVAAKIDDCPYEFSEWASQQTKGAKPEHMQFYYTRYPDSKSNGPLEGTLEDIEYDYDSKTRISGLGSLGISLINTAGANDNYYQTRLGAVAVAVSTKDISGAEVSFTLGTIHPQSKKYSIRLQYRLSDKGEVSDFYDNNNQLIEYKGSYDAEHEQRFKVDFPKNLLDKKYVQLIWRYYYNGEQVDMGSNARDELRIDDIIIQQKDIVDNQSKGDYNNILVANPNSQSFQWYKCVNDNLVILENETKQQLNISQPGEYAIAVDYGNCKHISDCSYFFVKELKHFAPSIYSSVLPNPSNGNFDLTFDESLTDVRIVVLDALGKVYETKAFKEVKNVRFDATKWSKGVYILNISTSDGRKDSRKIVIQ
ncbi:MAG TPA: CotH kinase family protein [Chitinophagales bacterium]|nr:CotH kinase family protein [Chitinophagales bacterium]